MRPQPLASVLVLFFLTTPLLADPSVPYATADWDFLKYGNHRAVLKVEKPADAVWARIPWRRRDADPQKKDVVVVELATGKEIPNRLVKENNREYGDVIFEARKPGEYAVYYMPYRAQRRTGPPYPVEYVAPRETASEAWLAKIGSNPNPPALPKAKVVRFEAQSDFHRFDPMEVVATAKEIQELKDAYPIPDYLVFPEDRKFAIRMTDGLPKRWIESGPSDRFNGEARPGEFYVFQLGLYAKDGLVESVAVAFSDLKSDDGAAIPASALRCFNTGGTDWLGRSFKKTVDIPKGKVQALWCGVDVPEGIAAGTYRGTVTVDPARRKPTKIYVKMKIAGEPIPERGDGDLWRLARLRWLDSTIGIDDGVAAPYTPLIIGDTTIDCLGRCISLDAQTGLPSEIVSTFPMTVDSTDAPPKPILAAPMQFVAQTAGGEVQWKGGKTTFLKKTPGNVTWESTSTAGPMTLHCWAKMEFDGYVNYRITLSTTEDVALTDTRLNVPYSAGAAKYIMGLGCRGGKRPKRWEWKWNIAKANNFLWLGDVNAGMQLKLKGPNYRWCLYTLEDRGLPKAWDNEGRGSCVVEEVGEDTVLAKAQSGPMKLKAGEKREYWFGILPTPLKVLDKRHWSWRYFHNAGVPNLDEVAKKGVTVVNIHQAARLNPYINYPFLQTEELSQYVKQGHEKGLKVKAYYTVRELSNFCAEIFPCRSLGHEIFTGGSGGGSTWLREHLVSDYDPAWHDPIGKKVDAAIATNSLSRWHNYYLEGLRWLIEHVGIDGLYLDGIGYDRDIMQRVRKVMDGARPGCLIDFHCGNHFGFRDLRINNACQFMELFPYIDSLWFGEGFSYDAPPDLWLVEISGIPYGLFGEMLGGHVNPWRGMIYGETGRLGWGANPESVWKLWDDFGIAEAKMIGYWVPDCPVKTGRDDILATAYVRKGRTLVAIASWAPTVEECKLKIDWKALGLDPAKATLYAPPVEGIQPAAQFKPDEAFPVVPGRGWMFWIDEKKHELPEGAEVFTSEDATAGRKCLLEEDFDGESLGDVWKTKTTTKPGAKVSPAKGKLEITAPANCVAYAERPLPPGSRLVQVRLTRGTDGGATWGPALTIVWPGDVLRAAARADGSFQVDDGTHNYLVGRFPLTGEFLMRFVFGGEAARLETSRTGKYWQVVTTIPGGAYKADPVAVRLGKTGPQGSAEDHHIPGNPGTSQFDDLRVYGKKAD